MSDYQVLCICITSVVIVVIWCIGLVLRAWIDYLQHRLLYRCDSNYIEHRLNKIECCIKALLEKKK